ncbi:MAG: DUF167 domain-containing protein [Candidatus Eisenbacteria bacterium]
MARLAVRVQPGARGSALVGWMADGTLKLRVSAPPEDGRANRAVVELLALALGLRPAAVRVVRGPSSRAKAVEVDGMDERELRSRITAALEAAEGNDGG